MSEASCEDGVPIDADPASRIEKIFKELAACFSPISLLYSTFFPWLIAELTTGSARWLLITAALVQPAAFVGGRMARSRARTLVAGAYWDQHGKIALSARRGWTVTGGWDFWCSTAAAAFMVTLAEPDDRWLWIALVLVTAAARAAERMVRIRPLLPDRQFFKALRDGSVSWPDGERKVHLKSCRIAFGGGCAQVYAITAAMTMATAGPEPADDFLIPFQMNWLPWAAMAAALMLLGPGLIKRWGAWLLPAGIVACMGFGGLAFAFAGLLLAVALPAMMAGLVAAYAGLAWTGRAPDLARELKHAMAQCKHAMAQWYPGPVFWMLPAGVAL